MITDMVLVLGIPVAVITLVVKPVVFFATVTVVVDAEELALPSFTVRLKTKAPAAIGAVNVGLLVEAEERVTGVPEV